MGKLFQIGIPESESRRQTWQGASAVRQVTSISGNSPVTLHGLYNRGQTDVCYCL